MNDELVEKAADVSAGVSRMTSRVGPAVDVECGYCSGVGKVADRSQESEPLIACPLCDGRGANRREVHPFDDLTRAVEHIQQVRVCMGLRRTENFQPKIGTPAYHVDAVEDALATLFQQLVVLLPEEWRRTEGGDA